MATAIEYALIAALMAVVITIGMHAWPTYNVAGTITVTKLRPAITEPARP